MKNFFRLFDTIIQMIMLVAAGDHFRLGWTAATCLNALASLREWATRSHRAYSYFRTVIICNFLFAYLTADALPSSSAK